jgi:hypothetical protein
MIAFSSMLLFPSVTPGAFSRLLGCPPKGGRLTLFVGVGAVINVQENGLIQVALIDVQESQGHVVQKLLNNDGDLLKRLLVKPTVPYIEYNILKGS